MKYIPNMQVKAFKLFRGLKIIINEKTKSRIEFINNLIKPLNFLILQIKKVTSLITPDISIYMLKARGKIAKKLFVLL